MYLVYPGADFTIHPAPADDWASNIIVDREGKRVAAFCTSFALDVFVKGVAALGKSVYDAPKAQFAAGDQLADDAWVAWEPRDDKNTSIYAFRCRDGYIGYPCPLGADTVDNFVPDDWVNHVGDPDDHVVAIKIRP